MRGGSRLVGFLRLRGPSEPGIAGYLGIQRNIAVMRLLLLIVRPSRGPLLACHCHGFGDSVDGSRVGLEYPFITDRFCVGCIAWWWVFSIVFWVLFWDVRRRMWVAGSMYAVYSEGVTWWMYGQCLLVFCRMNAYHEET